MDRTPKCLLKISHALPKISGKYRDVAEYILSSPEKIVVGRAKDIAEDCRCDESLIVRFCQKLGYKGFPDLKAALVSEFMPISLKADEEDSPVDSFKRHKSDFLDKNRRSLNDTALMLSEMDIKNAIDILQNSKRIFVIGVGSSGIVASDVQMKLLRLGFPVVYQSDPNLLLMLSGIATKDDCVLAISYTGESAEVICTAQHFKAVGAKVIAVSKFVDSKLAHHANVVLQTASDESVFRLGAMTSRLSQMFVIDFLILSLVMRNVEEYRSNILKTYSVLKESKNL